MRLRRRRRAVRRRPCPVAVAAVILVVVVVGACATTPPTRDADDRTGGARADAARPGGDRPGTSGPAGSTATTADPGPSAPRTAVLEPGAPTVAQYPVGTFWRDFVDGARGRTLRTLVHYPATATGEGTPPAPGAFPLVLFAHGYRLPAGGYERVLTTLAAHGYVVAAPAFPHTSAEVGDGWRGDIVNQPADLAFVGDQIVALGAAGPPVIVPMIERPDRWAIVGHSDGGLTASAIAYDDRYRDRRIVAAVVLTGGRALFPGTYLREPEPPPVLAVHGTADSNPYAASVGLARDVAATGTPAYLLTVENGGHIDPYMYDTALPSVAEAVAAFVDAYLRGDPSGVDRLRRVADDPGRTRLDIVES